MLTCSLLLVWMEYWSNNWQQIDKQIGQEQYASSHSLMYLLNLLPSQWGGRRNKKTDVFYVKRKRKRSDSVRRCFLCVILCHSQWYFSNVSDGISSRCTYRQNEEETRPMVKPPYNYYLVRLFNVPVQASTRCHPFKVILRICTKSVLYTWPCHE